MSVLQKCSPALPGDNRIRNTHGAMHLIGQAVFDIHLKLTMSVSSRCWVATTFGHLRPQVLQGHSLGT